MQTDLIMQSFQIIQKCVVYIWERSTLKVDLDTHLYQLIAQSIKKK